LIGSRARGDFKENSDYDIMIVTRRGKNYQLELKYKKVISEKSNIDYFLLSVHLWPSKKFKEQYKKGTSFVYCALRDKKILSTKQNLFKLKLPNCQIAGKERLNWAEKMLKRLKRYLKFSYGKNEKIISGFEIEELGYCAMHLCWAICMLHNFCPLSKYTILRESKKYFIKKEFKTIKRTYKFYSNQEIMRKINKKTFNNFYRGLSLIIKRLKQTNETSPQQAIGYQKK